MSRNGTAPLDVNREVLAARGRTHRDAHAESRERKVETALARPGSFGALLAWFHREWDADFPKRIHERGVEPDSALGAPRLAGAMRARMTALDEERARTASDYDPAHDTWSTGAAPRFPMMDALERYGQKHALLRRYLEAVAYGGFDWRRVGERRLRVWNPETGQFVPDSEHVFVVTHGALSTLWEIWSTGQAEAGRGEVA